VLRSLVLAAAGSPVVRRAATAAPLGRNAVRRFVAGETTADAVRVTAELVAAGLRVSLDHLGENTGAAADAEALRPAGYRTHFAVSEVVQFALRDAENTLARCHPDVRTVVA